jgi:hypothetical protein
VHLTRLQKAAITVSGPVEAVFLTLLAGLDGHVGFQSVVGYSIRHMLFNGLNKLVKREVLCRYPTTTRRLITITTIFLFVGSQGDRHRNRLIMWLAIYACSQIQV